MTTAYFYFAFTCAGLYEIVPRQLVHAKAPPHSWTTCSRVCWMRQSFYWEFETTTSPTCPYRRKAFSGGQHSNLVLPVIMSVTCVAASLLSAIWWFNSVNAKILSVKICDYFSCLLCCPTLSLGKISRLNRTIDSIVDIATTIVVGYCVCLHNKP